MSGYTEKEWKDTRISAAEGSGVAKAIKAFYAAFPSKQSEYKADMKAAFDAIDGFQKALATAKGKCNKAKTAKVMKPDPKKLEATIDLIDTWTKELEGHRTALTLGAAKWQKQALIDEMNVEFKSVDADLKQIEDELGVLTKALDKGDYAESQKSQTRAGFRTNTMMGILSPKGVEEKMGYAAQRLKIDKSVASVKECTPNKFPAWKKTLKEHQTELGKLETRLDQLEAQQKDPDPETSAGSPEYKKNLKIVVGDYNAVVTEVDSVRKDLGEVAKRIDTLEQVFPTLDEQKRPKGLEALGKVRDVVTKCEKDMIAALEKLRNSNGEIVKKKKGFGITGEDETKFLTPIMSKVLSKNKRLTGLVGNCRQRVNELLGE